MIKATRNGVESEFTDHVWEAFPKDKYGWVAVAPAVPKTVQQAIDKAPVPPKAQPVAPAVSKTVQQAKK